MADFSLLNAHLANIGAQVSPPSGASSTTATSIGHHEVEAEDVALPANTETEAIALPSFTPAAGATVQLSATLYYQNDGNNNANTQLEVRLKNNGGGILQFTQILSGIGSGEPEEFTFAAAIPVQAFETADGSPCVYSVTVETDSDSDGDQRIVTAELIANVLTT